ncbi:NAD-dependent epimerase/dehydratase family protein [Geitlerinema sp. PCC 7407]|uniref:NAD-dependent epimerase/dehydratase family protein n=1 Tax=Geitlerinema sp. PCC 7407 TaxID=1173025 RepID=UPI00029F811D|nr:NAD-dependent epimerase/dehydratase family protein [Geitlerinema sp. PCC 7407]AFY66424.1 NAD-dependent epimerase/dehydratase [Geitlerinema sp. PCC 7407]
MKVLLTSATGYIGSAVARALQLSHHQVVGIARSKAAAQHLERAGIHPHLGNLTDAESLERAAVQVDAIIHTAATNNAQMATVDRQAVATLLAALAETHKPFVYTSGVWVMGDTGETLADEAFPLNPSPIVAWRPAVENEVLVAADRGVRTVAIRPALVYGHGGGLLSMLMQAGREQGAVPVIGSGENIWSFVHVDDLATLYVKAMEQAPPGTLLVGASGEQVSARDVALAAGDAAGVGASLNLMSLAEGRQIWGDLANALALSQRVSGDYAKCLLRWTPGAPSVLADLTKGSYLLTAIAS